MKKFASCPLILAAMSLISGPAPAGAQEIQEKTKDLIAYYSYTGNTELVAKTLAGILAADVIRIEDVERPPREEAYGAGKEAATKGKAWPVKPFKKDVSAYDRIFVGCPVWFSMPAPQFNAFVEQVDFKDKQVVVFVTLGGGSYKETIKAMTDKIAAKSGKIVSSFHVRTKNVKNEDIVASTKEIAKQYSRPAPDQQHKPSNEPATPTPQTD